MTSIASEVGMIKTFRGEVSGWEIYIFNHILQIIPPSIGVQIRLPFNCEGYPRFHEVLDFVGNTCKGTFANSFYTLDISISLTTDNCELILYQNQNMIPLVHFHSVPVKVGEALHALGNGRVPPHKEIYMCLGEPTPDIGYSSGEAEFSDTEY